MKLLRPFLFISVLIVVGAFVFNQLFNSDGQSVHSIDANIQPSDAPAHEASADKSVELSETSVAAAEASDAAIYRPLDFLSPSTSKLVDRDISSDVAKLRKLALAGAPDAAYDLFRIFASCSVGTEADYCASDEVDVGEGISMLRKSAELKYWPAQVEFLRALYVHQGPPTQEDKELGIAYLKFAAENGAADAMFRLADFSVSRFDFTVPRETDNVPGDLSRVTAYGHFLAAASVYEDLGIRPNVVAFINDANAQLGPREVNEALEIAKGLLGRPDCCKVWKP